MPRSIAAEIVHLAELHARMTQDGVGGRHMEKEVRQREAQEIIRAGEFQLTPARLEFDLPLLATVDLRGRNTLQEIDRLLDPRLQFGEGFFGIGKARIVDAAETRGTWPASVSISGARRASMKEAPPACASPFFRMAERLPSARMKTGMEARYMEIAMGISFRFGCG